MSEPPREDAGREPPEGPAEPDAPDARDELDEPDELDELAWPDESAEPEARDDDDEPAEPAPPEEAPARFALGPRGRRVRDALSVVGLALAAFATGLLLFNNLIMPRLIHRVAERRLPDLTNLTFEQAEKVMGPVGIQVSRAGERFDPSVPRGFILSQDPPPETPVRGRKRVMVMVSLGEEYSSVPALFGESLRGARLLVERAGLRVGSITRAPSDDLGEGLVVDSDPPAETVLPRDAVVGLLVSTGSREEVYVMPDLLGREITGVRRSLEALGFRVITPPAAPSIGAVVVQDPPAGSRLARGATIVVQATGRMIR